jgi:peptide/nickel transport system substrate-binding protein
MSMKHVLTATAVVIALSISVVGMASAADLRIGVGAEATTLDPHYYNLNPNMEIDDHIYDYLVSFDAKGNLIPGLATSWKAIDDTTWEFKLRRNVKFHNGEPFTAADVLFTINRARKPTNSPDSYSRHFVRIPEVTAPDDFTVRVKTDGPFPNLVRELAQIAIISKSVGENVTLEDFNSGKAAIGTGPYKFEKMVPGDNVTLVRNDDYWGGKPQWDHVIFKLIVSGPARTAALRAGDVDLINYVPSADIEGFKKDPKFAVWQGVGNRVLYLTPDVNRDKSPFITDADGKPMDKNPMKDLRVRRAMSLAINRKAIVDRVMDGVGQVANQFLPAGFFGHDPRIKTDPFDPERARKLLAEAGYPKGFGVTLHATNDRYLNDAKIAATVAQMLTRIGVKTEVAATPKAIFFGKAAKLEYSLMQIGSAPATNEATEDMTYLLATNDPKAGMGAGNRGRYSNPEYDRLLGEAMRTIDDKKREKLLQDATRIGIGELGIIPIFYQVNVWASKKNISFTPRVDELTHAMDAKTK